MTTHAVHKLEERRHVRIACLGHDRERMLGLARLCAGICRPDDGFEFMIDAGTDAEAARETAVGIEMLWNRLPNPSLAHLCYQRHVLLLGADLVVDFSACEPDRAPEPGAAPRQPEIVDWEAPRPRGTSRRAAAPVAERDRRALALDMSLLCPRAPLVRVDPGSGSIDELSAAIGSVLRRAAGHRGNR